MLQNSRFTGHASTERNGACGTYKEEVAGSNPASPTKSPQSSSSGGPFRYPARRGELTYVQHELKRDLIPLQRQSIASFSYILALSYSIAGLRAEQPSRHRCGENKAVCISSTKRSRSGTPL